VRLSVARKGERSRACSVHPEIHLWVHPRVFIRWPGDLVYRMQCASLHTARGRCEAWSDPGLGRLEPPQALSSLLSSAAGVAPGFKGEIDWFGRSPMRTFIQPQKKHTEEKMEVRVDAGIAAMLKEYAEFLESPPGYVVTEVLRKAFRKDKAFAEWRHGRDIPNQNGPRPKAGRKQGQAETAPAAASS
jgi:hypothetical protein